MWSSGLTCALGVVALSAFCPGPSAFGAPVGGCSTLPAPLLGPVRAGHGAPAPEAPLLPLSINCQSRSRNSVRRSSRREGCMQSTRMPLLHCTDNAFFTNWSSVVTCLEQAYRCHFSNSICSLWVFASHFGNSGNNSNFLLLIIFVLVICDQWSLRLISSLPWGTRHI